jgi:hypothetical protein
MTPSESFDWGLQVDCFHTNSQPYSLFRDWQILSSFIATALVGVSQHPTYGAAEAISTLGVRILRMEPRKVRGFHPVIHRFNSSYVRCFQQENALTSNMQQMYELPVALYRYAGALDLHRAEITTNRPFPPIPRSVLFLAQPVLKVQASFRQWLCRYAEVIGRQEGASATCNTSKSSLNSSSQLSGLQRSKRRRTRDLWHTKARW